jgi:hypothetical protein
MPLMALIAKLARLGWKCFKNRASVWTGPGRTASSAVDIFSKNKEV